MKKTLIRNYAKLIARVGASVQKGQHVLICAQAEAHAFVALLAEESVSCAEVEKVIAESCKYVTATHLFDVYRGAQIGEGKKSMAFTVTFTPREKAISPEDADGYVRRIVKALGEKLGLSQR